MVGTIAYLDCFSGISGDMLLGAFLGAGLSLETLKDGLARLPLTGYQLSLEPFQDKGIQGMRFDVLLSEEEPHVRHLSDIVALLSSSALSPRVRSMALSIFQRLAEAEAAVHGTTVDAVHFHEVGALDAIVDICGAAIAIEALGVTQLYASPLPLSHGQVRTAHGVLPVPAPATLEILRNVRAPWRSSTAEGELVTPTGAAILGTLARFETPALAISQVGYGFGRKQFDWPNCLRLCLGQALGPGAVAVGQASVGVGEVRSGVGEFASAEAPDTDWVTVIESNIDNMSGEQLGGLMERLLTAGAYDVSYIPLQMKKNRPAVQVTIICSLREGDAMARLLLSESGTLGVRVQQVQRLKAQRSSEMVETPFGPMLAKVKRMGREILSAAPEYEECRRIAEERHLPLGEVYEVARQAIQVSIIHRDNE
jgi:uncharacterized protein (TIGR00299 family) protein